MTDEKMLFSIEIPKGSHPVESASSGTLSQRTYYDAVRFQGKPLAHWDKHCVYCGVKMEKSECACGAKKLRWSPKMDWLTAAFGVQSISVIHYRFIERDDKTIVSQAVNFLRMRSLSSILTDILSFKFPSIRYSISVTEEELEHDTAN